MLKSTAISTVFNLVQLKVVVTAPDSQLFSLPSVCRPDTVADEADDCDVVCKLKERDRGFLGNEVVCIQREEQWR